MGRVRLEGLNFTMDHLQREVDTFRKFAHDPEWMTEENHEKRQALVEGLAFFMLNLADDVDQEEAWIVFHAAMDDYHLCCDNLQIS